MIRLTAFALLLAATAAALPAQSLIYNGGFERGDEGWFPFLPSDAKGTGATFEIVIDQANSGAASARLHSQMMARHGFAVRGSRSTIPVSPGERYRITAWVRIDADTLVRQDTPGPLIRLTPLDVEKKDSMAGAFFLNADNKLTQGAPPSATKKLPLTWTKLEAVIETPSDTAYLVPFFLGWYTEGSIYFDDISLDKVSADTPLTPLTDR
jgi:hypothetical protein